MASQALATIIILVVVYGGICVVDWAFDRQRQKMAEETRQVQLDELRHSSIRNISSAQRQCEIEAILARYHMNH
jgi:hypothetical protein